MGNRVPLLLHACCAPCSIEPLLSLREEGFEPIICWTNPNIQPVSEHDLRFETLLTWAQRPEIDVQVLEGTCDRAAWESAVARYGMNREARCILGIPCDAEVGRRVACGKHQHATV